MLKTGEIVMIYHDPLYCEHEEGKAELLAIHDTENPLQKYCEVRFLDDNLQTQRFVHTEKH